MKKLLTQNLLILILTIVTYSCSDRERNVHHAKYTEYHVYHHEDNTWLWYYVLFNNHGGYYYYTSPTQVTTFSSVTWQTSTINPIPEGDEIVSQQESTLTEENANFSEEMQADLPSEQAVESMPSETANPEQPSESGAATPESESPSESSSESSSSESGGDSGGDGGGGGD